MFPIIPILTGLASVLGIGGQVKQWHDEAKSPWKMNQPSGLSHMLGIGQDAYGAYSSFAKSLAAEQARRRSASLAESLSPGGFGKMNPYGQRMVGGMMGNMNQANIDDIFAALRAQGGQR